MMDAETSCQNGPLSGATLLAVIILVQKNSEVKITGFCIFQSSFGYFYLQSVLAVPCELSVFIFNVFKERALQKGM